MPAGLLFDADGLHWPGILADIADAAGPLAAHRVADARGGRMTYFPTPDRLTDDHWLVTTCGWEAARTIARRVGGSKVEVPLGPLSGNRAAVRRAIRAALAEGVSGQEIARRVGVTGRTVRNVKNNPGRHGQADQFRLV